MKYETRELITHTIIAIVAITFVLCFTLGTVSCNRDDNKFKVEMADRGYVQQQRLGAGGTIWVKGN